MNSVEQLVRVVPLSKAFLGSASSSGASSSSFQVDRWFSGEVMVILRISDAFELGVSATLPAGVPADLPAGSLDLPKNPS